MMATISPRRISRLTASQGLHRAEGDADILYREERARGAAIGHAQRLREGLGVADAHVGPHGAGAAVLVGDLGLDLHDVALRVERLDQRRVLLGDEAPAHLARAGDLLVVGVELLVQQEEPADLRARELGLAEEAPVHPLDLLPDQLVHLGLLGEVGVARVGDVPPLRPAPHRPQVDVDERGHEGPARPHAHRLLDVRRELELVLEVLRREERAVGEPADVPGPVDDLEVAVRVDDARVARVDPAVLEGLARGLGVLVVADEDARAPVEHLARPLIRSSTPGSGVPTVSSFTSPSRWMHTSALDSVMP